MVTTKKTSSASKSTTARKTPIKVAVKKTVSSKQSVKKPITNTKSTYMVTKTPAQTPATTTTPAIGVTSPKLLKEKKVKLVRDSFTIPKPEYLVLDALKARALVLGQAVKKSELLRAGIKALNAMSDSQYLAALKTVPTLKSGRPGK